MLKSNMSDFIDSMFGGDDSAGEEKMPIWVKIIIIIVFIIFVLPVIIIAIPMLALAVLALIYGESSSSSDNVPAPVKDGAAIVKETFSASW